MRLFGVLQLFWRKGKVRRLECKAFVVIGRGERVRIPIVAPAWPQEEHPVLTTKHQPVKCPVRCDDPWRCKINDKEESIRWMTREKLSFHYFLRILVLISESDQVNKLLRFVSEGNHVFFCFLCVCCGRCDLFPECFITLSSSLCLVFESRIRE